MLFAVLKKPDLPDFPEAFDGFELRLDHFDTIDLKEIQTFQRACAQPLLFTLRKTSQGGCYKGSEEARLEKIEELFALKPAFFDLEYDTDPAFIVRMKKTFPEVKVILSYHDFEKTAPDLDLLYEEIAHVPVFAYKIATFANSSLDALRMLLFVKKRNNVIGLCMGEMGLPTRILGPVIGNLIDYVSLGDPSAPGQLELRDLTAIYRYPHLNQETALYALIGDPVDASIGHLFHNAFFAREGINAVYFKMVLKKEELSTFFALARQLPFVGISVTMPLKEEVLPDLGAINTLLFTKGEIQGYNTDGKAAADAIEKKILLKGKKLVLIGSGGAAKAIAKEVLQRGAQLFIVNRTAEKAVAIAGERGGGLESLAGLDYDLLVNTTPEAMPIDPDWILPKAIVMDIRTVPRQTPFLLKAKEKGCQVIYGIEMFLNQAIAQQQIWQETSCHSRMVY
jgi:3-dehydroquinate dehydratase/shikimate dehydrogenase